MFEHIKLAITISELIRLINLNFSKVETSSEEIKEDLNQLDEKVDGINANLTKQIDDLEQDVNDKYNELIRDIDDLTDVVEEDFAQLTQQLNAETTARENADDSLGQRIDGLQADLGDLNSDLSNYKESNDKAVSDLTQTVQDNFSTLDTKIDTTSQTINQRITDVTDELQQSIEENVVALQQEDTALQNQINTHSQQITKEISDRTQADTTLNNRITEVAEELNATIEENVTALQQADANLQTQITTNKNDIADLTQVVQDDYDELKDLIDQEIEDRETADSNLQDQIDNLKARGRFLSLWDATTGLPESTPQISPYTYNTGDYFIVDKVGETNYRPTGTQYVIGQASTEVETEELTTDDVYYFDGATWHLQINHGKTVSFANLAGEPTDNTNLKNALDSKQDVGDYATNTRVTEVENKIPSLTGYATELYVQNYHDDTKQDTLVSGTNIKTVNNQSILGEGNIEIESVSSFADLQGNPYDNKALADELNSLNIISLLAVYLRDSIGNDLLDVNGLRLTVRRT